MLYIYLHCYEISITCCFLDLLDWYFSFDLYVALVMVKVDLISFWLIRFKLFLFKKYTFPIIKYSLSFLKSGNEFAKMLNFPVLFHFSGVLFFIVKVLYLKKF